MKKTILTILLGCLVALIGQAQPPKYGVVDIDSVLNSIPEVQRLNQKLDSIRVVTMTSIEPLATQLQVHELRSQLISPTDTIELKRIEEDLQLVYQEIKLVQQKGARAANQLLQQGKIYTEQVTNLINNKATDLNLMFVMPTQKRPVYNPYGLEILLESPLYFFGDAIDITSDLIKSLAKSPNPTTIKESTKNHIKNKL